MSPRIKRFNENIEEEVKQTYYIYTLTDPTDGEVKYIGKTKDIKDRLWRHTGPSNLKSLWIPKNKWIQWLKKQDLKPIIEILEETDAEHVDACEIYWISQFKQWGFKLKNVASGGGGADYWTGKKLSPEHIMKKVMNDSRRKDICEYEIGTDRFVAEYVSLSDASRKTGHKLETISLSCKGKAVPRKFGVYWRYKDNYFPYVEPNLKHNPEDLLKMKMNHPMRRTICQYEIGTDKLIAEFDSSHDVERKTGYYRGHVIKCCKGIKNYNSVGGYYWRYKDNYFPLILSNQNHWNPSNLNIPYEPSVIIEQYDKEHNLIKTYDKSYILFKDGFLINNIKRSIKDNKPYKNYYWKIIKKK